MKFIFINFIKKFLFRKTGKSFIRKFDLINKFLLRYPLSVKYIDAEDIYIAIDTNGDKIFFTVAQRVERFKKGINYRLSYLANEYFLNEIEINDDDIIIDVGANIGELSMFINLNSKAKVFAVEPEEREFNCLIKNVDKRRTTGRKTALWKEKGKMTLYQKNNTNDTSLFEIEGYESKIEIDVDTLDNLINTNIEKKRKIKLLKLEAEGAEPEILLGAKENIHRIEYIAADCGPERGLKKDTTFIQVNNLLEKEKFRIIDYYHKRGIFLFKNSRFTS